MQRAVTGAAPTELGNPLDWTLIQNWRFADGDMVAIGAAFLGDPDGRPGVIWSPDGTVITLASNSDVMISFSCSTPWDPDTATWIQQRGVTNPGHMFANKDGTQIWVDRVGDNFVNIPASNFVVALIAVPETSGMTKAERGFTGSADTSYYPVDDFSACYMDGDTVSGNRVHRIDFSPDGNLDAPSIGPDDPINWTQNGSIGGSKVTKTGRDIYRGAGAQGVERLQFGTPFDATTLVSLGTFDNETEVGFRPETVWFNPEDTTEVWITGDVGGLELARMLTNI